MQIADGYIDGKVSPGIESRLSLATGLCLKLMFD